MLLYQHHILTIVVGVNVDNTMSAIHGQLKRNLGIATPVQGQL